MERCDGGARIVNYVKELKIAVLNGDLRKIEELSDVAFKSNDVEELKEAVAIIRETVTLLDAEKAKALDSMQNIQKMKQYELGNKKELL
jgi:hypothetical protein